MHMTAVHLLLKDGGAPGAVQVSHRLGVKARPCGNGPVASVTRTACCRGGGEGGDGGEVGGGDLDAGGGGVDMACRRPQGWDGRSAERWLVGEGCAGALMGVEPGVVGVEGGPHPLGGGGLGVEAAGC